MENLLSRKEAELIQIVKNMPNDRSADIALEEIYKANIAYVQGFFYSKFNTSNIDFKEVYNEVFLRFHKSILVDSFKQNSTISTFMCGIIKNVVYNILKKSDKLKLVEQFSEISSEDIEEFEHQNELEKIINEIISKTDLNCRESIRLFIFEEKSHKDIAEYKSIKESSSKNLLSRCYEKLRDIIMSNPFYVNFFKKYRNGRNK